MNNNNYWPLNTAYEKIGVTFSVPQIGGSGR